jgi:D-alanyl-D-alanine carboxypeptidase
MLRRALPQASWRLTSVFSTLGFALAGALLLLVTPASARVARTDSSIVIDAETGAVLSEHNADALGYPASLTKMMTLYLTFEAIEHGHISLDQALSVSYHAARQAPSKLGLHEGQMVQVRDLILGMVTKSANDAAVTMAEGLAGSESVFAERMTLKARALGMTNTTYRDASGLPNPNQLTTARDLAKLARALYRDFPREYAFFATAEFTFHGETFENHNHLMQSYEGMDGIKTGYIRASGFNLAASAVRNKRRLIGVVMGGPSPHARDLEMADLLDEGFNSGTALASTKVDRVETAAKLDKGQEDGDTASPTAEPPASSAIVELSPIPEAEAAPSPRHLRLGHHHGEAGRWSIQVGAFSAENAAARAGAAALGRLPGGRSKSLEVVAPGQTDKEPYYRARIVSFSKHEATKACRVLHRKHMQCAVVAPGATQQAAVN